MQKKQFSYPITPCPEESQQSHFTSHKNDKILEKRLFQKWIEVVGERIAEYARPLHFQDGILIIRVKNTHWMQELHYLKGRYTQQLNEELNSHIIREVRLEHGELPPLVSQPVEPSRPEWLSILLPQELINDIETKLAHLPENEIKESARRIMINHYKLTWMRQRHKRPRYQK